MATSRKQQQDFPVSGFLPEPRRPIVILRPIHDDEVDGIDDDVASPARDLQDAVQKFVSEGREEKDGADRWTQRQRLVFMIGSAVAMWGVTIGGIAVATTLLG